jgi:GAF domain-containing protein/HAMP domain-containing protein
MIQEERVSGYMRAALRPIPLLAGLAAGSVALIYLMGILGVLESLGWQMLVAALVLLAVAVLHRFILRLAERGRGVRAYLLHAVVTVGAGLALTFLWAGVTPLNVLIAWIAPAIGAPARIPRRSFLSSVGLSVAGTLAILLAEFRPVLPRMRLESTGGFAAVLLVGGLVVLYILLIITTQGIRFRLLETRLVGTLLPILAVPILFTTVIAALNAFTTSQEQFRNSLEAVSSLKRGQLSDIVREVFSDLSSIQQGGQDAPSIMSLLQRPGANDEEYRLNASLASSQIRNVIVTHPASNYEEVLVLDTKGNAVLSTYLLNQGVNFGDQEFFRQGLTQPTAALVRYPGLQNTAGDYKLVGAAPFYGTSADEILGVVVAVASSDAVVGVLQPTSGLEAVNTYLVDSQMNAVLPGALGAQVVRANPLRTIVQNRSGSGDATYTNYAGAPVLGYYAWSPDLQAAIVSEVPQNVVFSRSLAAVIASGLVGLITIIIAGIAMLSAARAISEPVSGLAVAAESLASGELATRAVSDREDEIGRLANSFNTMAAQMQGVIGNLEQRVAERTQALEQQSLRLQTAAEVARDAALAPTLDELLERASRLVLARFGVDDVGIYLLDEKRQYAILQAAPSETGKQMLAANFRIPVGERGAIGQAASSGEAQLVLRGSSQDTPVGDEYHTGTQSQLALPLRTYEGTLGLLDLQSESPQAFTPADASTIQVLADQLAAAIERDRLLLQVQQRLAQLEQSYRRFTQESWSAYGRTGSRAVGYRYDNVRLDPVASVPEEARRAIESGSTFLSGDGAPESSQTAYIPIRLRGQTLGVVATNFRGGRPQARTMAMLEQAADRLGTALENVRLLEESLKRASKERLISEITAKISSSISVRNVLQTAVEELGRALPGSEVSISFRGQSPAREKESPS